MQGVAPPPVPVSPLRGFGRGNVHVARNRAAATGLREGQRPRCPKLCRTYGAAGGATSPLPETKVIPMNILVRGTSGSFAVYSYAIRQFLVEGYYPGEPPFRRSHSGVSFERCASYTTFSSEKCTRQHIFQLKNVQQLILKAYDKDFVKHAEPSLLGRIRLLWNNIPAQLAKENKKFIYKALKEGARGRNYEEALQWLDDAG